MPQYHGTAIPGTYGVLADSTIAENALVATSTAASYAASYGGSTGGPGVYGVSSAPSYAGVHGDSSSSTGIGVQGICNGLSGVGVRATATGASGVAVLARGGKHAVFAEGTSGGGTAIYAQMALGVSGTVAEFNGDTRVAGTLRVDGPIIKNGGGFAIDHPLDPANRELVHSFVESPDRKNIYDGIAIADSAGSATVEVPSYFHHLNGEFRYQLTALGGPAPNLHVASELDASGFSLAGAMPGQRISWQVTGIRKDPWAIANPLVVEQDKLPEERGLYRCPELYGRPETESYAADQRRRAGSPPEPADVFAVPSLPESP